MPSPKNTKTRRKKKLVINPHFTIIPESGSFEIFQTVDTHLHHSDEDVGLRLTPPIPHEPPPFKFTNKKSSPNLKKTNKLPKINENTSFFSTDFISYSALVGGAIGIVSSLMYYLLHPTTELIPLLQIIFFSTLFAAILSVSSTLIIKNILDSDSSYETPMYP